jgi:hypothetical protein
VIACGLWLARRRLVAVLVGDRGEPWRTLRAALTDDARFGLVEHLAHAGCDLVATEALARTDLLPAQAARRGLAVWLADDQLAAALFAVAAVRDSPRAAALLARLRLVAHWRPSLRPLTPAAPDRQLPLL